LFLTGEEEIEDTCNKIQDEIRKQRDCGKIKVIPLYSSLTPV